MNSNHQPRVVTPIVTEEWKHLPSLLEKASKIVQKIKFFLSFVSKLIKIKALAPPKIIIFYDPSSLPNKCSSSKVMFRFILLLNTLEAFV